ncbi:ATP-binding protein [Nocardiopsis lucentensis]|uniref:ATP-binding protein n=1 Tax=Nocardiopsis lucentensis TaxID=53441 RepID=UPI0003464B1D|nr:ATP-binding protein [Nocardiopsis lucentensis]
MYTRDVAFVSGVDSARSRERAPAPRATWRLPDTPAAARLARGFVAEFLQNLRHDRPDHHDPDLDHRTSLVVSELVTNAVVHGQPPVDLSVVWTAADTGLRIDVHDRGDAPSPSAAPSASEEGDTGEESGRGLFLVSLMAARWGIGPRLPYGTHAWAELRTA